MARYPFTREALLGLSLWMGSLLSLGVSPSLSTLNLAFFSSILVFVQAISQRTRQSHAESVAATNAILEAMPDAVLVVNAGNGKVMFQKDAANTHKSLLPALLATKTTLVPELSSFATSIKNNESAKSYVLTLADDHVLECRASFFAPDQVLVIIRDITAAHIDDTHLRYLATHDQLTGLLNRSSFLQALDQAIARAARSGKSLGLLFLDLNHFKAVNDTLGHAAGDDLLKQVANRIQGAMRVGDSAFRLAGDEFTVIVEQLESPNDVQLIADKLRELLNLPYFDSASAPAVTAAIGAVAYPAAGITAKELLNNADKAMYLDKAEKRKTAPL